MERDDMDTEEIKKKAGVFYTKNIPIHVVTEDGDYSNGYIKELSSDFFIILDRFRGEKLIFLREIEKLTQFTGDYSTLKEYERKGGNQP